MRAEIRLEFKRRMSNVQKELERMFTGLLSKVNNLSTGKSVSMVTEEEFSDYIISVSTRIFRVHYS